MISAKSAIAWTEGDPSVGICGASFEILGPFIFDDTEDREAQRTALKECFGKITDFPVTVEFDDELRGRARDETRAAITEVLDRLSKRQAVDAIMDMIP